MLKPWQRILDRARLTLFWLLIGSATFAQNPAADRPRPSRQKAVSSPRWEVVGTRGVVVAGGQEAVEAGIEVLRSGGNAADAAAATLLAQTVTDANQFCFGGEVPILIYDAQRGVVEVLAGQGAAPGLAVPDYFRKKDGIPGSGAEAATVPATLDACLTLLDRQGTRTFEASARPMLAILDRGEYPWHVDLAQTIRRMIDAERRSSNDRRRGLRLVADFFYRGPIAREIDEWA